MKQWTEEETAGMISEIDDAKLAGKTQSSAYAAYAEKSGRKLDGVRSKYQTMKAGGAKPRGKRKTGTIIENPRSEHGLSAFTFRYNGELYNIAEGTSLSVVCATMGYLKDGGAL
jgi:hypothetical protein